MSTTRVVEETVLCPSPSVVAVEADDEAVLVDEATGALHVLNAAGSLLWACLDGHATLGEICRDVAEGLGVEYESVLGDARSLAAALLDEGLAGAAGAPHTARDAQRETRADALAAGSDTARRRPTDESLAGARCLTLTVGDRRVVVASTDDDVVALLHGALGGSIGAADTADVSLLVGGRRGRVPGVHSLFVGTAPALVTTSLDRLVHAALTAVDAFVPRRDDLVPLHGRLFVRGSEAVLMAASHGSLLDVGERRVARLGWQPVDAVRPMLDPTSLEVVVPAPSLPVDRGGMARLEAVHPSPPASGLVPRRCSLRALVGVGYAYSPESLASPARRVVALVPFVLADDRITARALDALWRASKRAGVHWLVGFDHREVPEIFRRLRGR